MNLVEQHAADASRFADLIDSAGPEDWDRPSPCADWNARELLDHVFEWLPGFLERTGVSLAPVDPSDPSAAWRKRTADVDQILNTQADVEFESEMFGTMTVGEAIEQFYLADLWMHTWDLGRALGQHPDLGEQRCAEALVRMEPMEDALRGSGQFGPRVEVPSDASAQDRFLGFIGRDPRWEPAQ